MTKKVDKDPNYMYETWGTTNLTSDYGIFEKLKQRKSKHMHNFQLQNELHAKIRNDDDYDDWEYGTEPFYGNK